MISVPSLCHCEYPASNFGTIGYSFTALGHKLSRARSRQSFDCHCPDRPDQQVQPGPSVTTAPVRIVDASCSDERATNEGRGTGPRHWAARRAPARIPMLRLGEILLFFYGKSFIWDGASSSVRRLFESDSVAPISTRVNERPSFVARSSEATGIPQYGQGAVVRMPWLHLLVRTIRTVAVKRLSGFLAREVCVRGQ